MCILPVYFLAKFFLLLSGNCFNWAKARILFLPVDRELFLLRCYVSSLPCELVSHDLRKVYGLFGAFFLIKVKKTTTLFSVFTVEFKLKTGNCFRFYFGDCII